MEKKKGMKNIFKKLHIGSNHDANRSSNDPTSSSSSSSCATADHRTSSTLTGQISVQSPAAAASPPQTSPTVNVTSRQQDYYSSEEEYQVQLALALSVSNSESRGDTDSDQIRAAKLLSLGQHSSNNHVPDRGDAAADKLSRQYWVS